MGVLHMTVENRHLDR